MSSRIVRSALLAAVVAGVLVPVSAAAAAYAPRLVVTSVAGAPGAIGTAANRQAITVHLHTTADDDATARFVLYVPLGYRTGRPVPGLQVGTASATALTASGATVALTGNVIGATDDDASPSCDPVGSAVWLLQLARSGTLIRVPLVVVDAPAASSTFASSTITGCLPASTSAESGGLRLLSASLTLAADALTQPMAAGTYRWRARLTPFAAGATGEDAAATVEAQALVRLRPALGTAAKLVVQRTPVDVKVTRTIGGKTVTAVEHKVLVTRVADVRGTALGASDPSAYAPVTVLGGTSATSLRRLVQVTPAADGSWTTRIQIDSSAPAVFFQATLSLPSRDLGPEACTPSFGASVDCVSVSDPALRLASPVVRLATGR